MARGATSRGTRLPYLGYHSSRKYQRSDSGMDCAARLSFLSLGTQTRPPSPRADSDMRRSLSSPGDGGGVNLDELAVGVVGALLVEGGLGGAGADDGVGGLAEDGSVASGADD